jgi:hemoglobin
MSFQHVSDNDESGTTVSCTSVGVLNSQTHAHKSTLLHKLGGSERLREAVDIYYDKIAQDSLLAPFFVQTDMKLLKWHQFNFLSIAFDNRITNNFDLTELILNRHEQMFESGLSEIHFDAMMTHFKLTFLELNIPNCLIDEALLILRRLRPAFVEGAIQARKKKQTMKRLTTIHFAVGAAALISVGAIKLYRNLLIHK